MKTYLKAFLAIFLFVTVGFAQQSGNGTLQGRALDTNGALLGGVSITLVDQQGKERVVQSGKQGSFTISNISPGIYTIRASAAGFAAFENTAVDIQPGKQVTLDITLEVTVNEQVNVSNDSPLGTDPDSNATATVLKEKDIEALPDDPAELDAALRALAGPGAGPNGGEIFVDGFSGAKLPPRDTIKEVRLNQNPFSSEYDRMGLGRIEIITKPGSEKLRGEFETQFEDETLNSRNPYAANRPPFHLRTFEGNLSGPIVKNRASFFVDAEHQAIDNNSLINAQLLDTSLNRITLQQGVVTPTVGIEVEPRVDIKINEKNSLTMRYEFARDTQNNAGLGGFDLPSRAYNNIGTDHVFRVTENAVIAPTVVNEARFQFVNQKSTRTGDTGAPTIRVNDAFTSGGANIGLASNKERRFEFQNNITALFSKHTLKVGGRIRNAKVTDIAPGNFAGTFTFSTLDQYRSTILNLPGAYPTQFSIAGGNPEASVNFTDWGIYAQDDWRIHPKLTLSLGLRYENQTGVTDNSNFAPRFSFAFAPGAGPGKSPKTVFRGGFGVFYDRFGRNLILQTNRFNGVNQQQYVIDDETASGRAILDSVIFNANGTVTNLPNFASLGLQPQTIRIIDEGLSIPRTYQTALSVERQLPRKTTVSLSYVYTSIGNLLRSRNINAPIGGVRPNPAGGNIFQYESTGRYNQNQLIFNIKSNFTDKVTIFGNYSFGSAKSDTEGPGTFPADPYDTAGEYGNSFQDIRHRFTLGGSYSAPFGLRFSPFLSFRTGVPFNIVTGEDANGDTLFTERPSFATSLSEPGILITRFGAFDPTPETGDTLIPRNFGRGKNYLGVNLTVAREFEFGPSKEGDGEKPYKLEFSVQARNIFNRTNEGTPVGNLSSLRFGQSVASAGAFGGNGGSATASNRRIKLIVQFSF